MKRLISFLICMLFLLTGCVGAQPGSETAENSETGTPTEKVTDAKTEAPTEPVTETPTTEAETEPVTESPFKDPDPEVLAAPAATQFTVSRALGNDMVIQRNEYIRIWGFANEDQNGRRVNAEFAGLTGAALIENGHWLITLNGSLPECTEPRPMRIYGDGVEVVIENVLVGDVYWVVGQSNIHYTVQDIKNEKLANEAGRTVRISDDDLIRLNRNASTDATGVWVGSIELIEDVPVRRGWQKPGHGAALLFSALGYFTAVQIYDKLEGKIPIGLIEFDGNGLGLNSFCPNEVCDAQKIDKKDKDGVYRCNGVVNNGPSRFMYNQYMYPFQNMPISGIIWYQGESDMQGKNATQYPSRFRALITELRDRHDQINHDYPVYIIEFPPIKTNYFPFANVRAYMGTIPNVLKNSHLCQSSDLWKDMTYENNLHPYIKWEQSERMAKIILAGIYDIGDPTSEEGPTAASLSYENDGLTAIVKFRNVGSGLKFEGGEAKGIKVKASSASWSNPETIEIVGTDTLKITAKKKIKAVGYNINDNDMFPETINLCNSEGVPCNAFIID